MMSARLPLSILALLASLAAMTQARAAPLDAETCARLKVEQGELEAAGVGKDMAMGPEWAKVNLGLEKLQRVQRFIEIEEQLLFRCRSKAIVSLTPGKDSADQDDDNNNAKDDKGGKASDPKQQPQSEITKKPAQRATKPAARAKKSPSKRAAREPTEAGVTSIEKRPPKAKIDDAYKPPPVDPSVNPFANQFAPSPGN